MADTRPQIIKFIEANITDPLLRQNTAAVVRTVLTYMTQNLSTLADDGNVLLELQNYYTKVQVDAIIEGLVINGGSVVTKSEINGNIRVNGVEIKVYTDTDVLKKQEGGTGTKFLADDNTYKEIVFPELPSLPNGTGGNGISWIITPDVRINANLKIEILNKSPNPPTASYPGTNVVYDFGIELPFVITPPAAGESRVDVLDVGANHIYYYIPGIPSSVAGATPALLNGRLRAASFIWNGGNVTVYYPPESAGYWGAMPRSATDNQTIEQYVTSLLPKETIVNPQRLLGRHSLTAGSAEELQLGSGLFMAEDKVNIGFVDIAEQNNGTTSYFGVASYPGQGGFLHGGAYWTGYLSVDIPLRQRGPTVFVEIMIEEHPGVPDDPARREIITHVMFAGRLGLSPDLPYDQEGHWESTRALIVTNDERRNLPVHFTQQVDGTWRVYIGTATTEWYGISAYVKAAAFGGVDQSITEAIGSWTLTRQTALTGRVDKVENDNLPISKSSGSGSFTPIAVNAYGNHPAFNTQNELNIWLLKTSMNNTL